MVEQIKPTLDGQKVGNFTIKYTDLDDSSAAKGGDWDGTVETSNANLAADDPDAMVYIGTYNSGAAKLSDPDPERGLPDHGQPGQQLSGPDPRGRRRHRPRASPARTTRAAIATTPASSTPTTTRAAASSEWAQSLGFKKAYVIDDGQTYGQGIGRAWAQHFGKIGGTVVSANGSSESYDPKATDFAALGQKIKASGADVVFVGAITGQGTGKLWKDVKSVNPTIQMFGPDGVNEKSWFDGAGSSAQRHVPDLRWRRHQPAPGHRQGLGG